jgi:hypothetical protein
MLAPNHRTIPSVQFRQMHGALAFVFSVFVGGFAFLVSGLLSASKMNSEQGILRVSAAGLAFAAFFLFARQPVKISIRDNIVYCRKLFTKKFDLGNFQDVRIMSFQGDEPSESGLQLVRDRLHPNSQLDSDGFICVGPPDALERARKLIKVQIEKQSKLTVGLNR